MRKTLEDIWNLPRDIKEIKRIFQKFDRDQNPKVLKEIIACAKRNSIINNSLKVVKTHDMILRAEKRAKERDWNYACKEALKEMDINYEIRVVKNIPARDGTLYVCNHPWGLPESAILFGGLGSLLSEKRKLKLVVTNHLRFIKGFEEVVYFVHSPIKKINLNSTKKALKYLNDGGDLAIFPSGRMSKAGLEEYTWKDALGTFILHSSYVVPMWFSGPNHAVIYNLLSKFKKTEKSRLVFSLREAWNKVGKTVVLNIGEPITSKKLKELGNNGVIVQYLRRTAEALKVNI